MREDIQIDHNFPFLFFYCHFKNGVIFVYWFRWRVNSAKHLKSKCSAGSVTKLIHLTQIFTVIQYKHGSFEFRGTYL